MMARKFMYVPNTVRDTQDGFLGNPREGWKSYIARYKNEGLADVRSDEKLYIVGHGTLAGTSLASLDADALLEALKADQLDRQHVDFHLFSCYSGVKMPGAGKCFAEAFAYAIRDYYKHAKVTGYLGAVRFNRDAGQKMVSKVSSWANIGGAYEELERARDNKVSFSIKRKMIGSNTVISNQAETHIATVSKTTKVESSQFGDATINSTKVVVY
jgi:hypothetical protein